MPVKARFTKRRIDPAILRDAWEMPLIAGRDFFGELRAIGVVMDSNGRPNQEQAHAAWLAYGQQLLAERGPTEGQTWGELKFGRPWEDEQCQ